jgi:hypothetical protein
MDILSSINIIDSLRNGAIGAIGAIPATFAAHPLDAIKINSQVTGERVRTIFPRVVSNGLYNGLFAGMQQKVLTRGPMFLFSTVGTNICQHGFGMEATIGI